jgi:hypothetical protein
MKTQIELWAAWILTGIQNVTANFDPWPVRSAAGVASAPAISIPITSAPSRANAMAAARPIPRAGLVDFTYAALLFEYIVSQTA